MLIPLEKPYLDGFNSYYLQLEKFIEHMQGDIGSGGIHCLSRNVEMLIFFNENEVINTLIQKENEKAGFTTSYDIVRSVFYDGNFVVKVFQFDAHAIFFWAQMPAFQRAKASLKSTEIPLPDLIFRLSQKQFSGFIDIRLVKKTETGLLFFHEGKRIGGSYSWGKGGLSVNDDDYNTMLGLIQASEGIFSFGSFIKEEPSSVTAEADLQKKKTAPTVQSAPRIANPVYNELRPALEEFLFFFIQTIQNKNNVDALAEFNEHVLSRIEAFPFLDPMRAYFEYSNGVVRFSSNAPVEKITRAIITCAWEVIRVFQLQADFSQELDGLKTLHLFQRKNISIEG